MTTTPLSPRSRVSPRQVIVVVFSAGDASAFRNAEEPLLLDLLGTVVGLNGVSITVVAIDRALGRRVARSLPAGVEFLIPPRGEPAIGWTARKLIDKGFERILFISADVIGLPVRVISTALSAIESESAVRADTPSGNPYLFGVSATRAEYESNVHSLTTFDEFESKVNVRPTRGMERFQRLSELADLAEVRTLVTANARLLPRLSSMIEMSGVDAPPRLELHEGQGH